MIQCINDENVSDFIKKEYIEPSFFSLLFLENSLNNIVDYALLNSNQFYLKIEEFDLIDCLNEIVKLIKAKCDLKGLEFVFHFNNLPRQISSDKQRIKQIALNILDNAIKFTYNGRITLNVNYESKINGNNYVHFEVQDTGIGNILIKNFINNINKE